MDPRPDRSSTVSPLVVPEIVGMPDEIDITNADAVTRELDAAFFRPGVAVVIADMTRTRFCDSSGIRSLLAASDTAAASHAELRLVVAGPAVLRALQVMGVDRMLALYPSMGAALTGRLP